MQFLKDLLWSFDNDTDCKVEKQFVGSLTGVTLRSVEHLDIGNL